MKMTTSTSTRPKYEKRKVTLYLSGDTLDRLYALAAQQHLSGPSQVITQLAWQAKIISPDHR